MGLASSVLSIAFLVACGLGALQVVPHATVRGGAELEEGQRDAKQLRSTFLETLKRELGIEVGDEQVATYIALIEAPKRVTRDEFERLRREVIAIERERRYVGAEASTDRARTVVDGVLGGGSFDALKGQVAEGVDGSLGLIPYLIRTHVETRALAHQLDDDWSRGRPVLGFHNQFTGFVPYELEWLELSRRYLAGELPVEISGDAFCSLARHYRDLGKVSVEAVVSELDVWWLSYDLYDVVSSTPGGLLMNDDVSEGR